MSATKTITSVAFRTVGVLILILLLGGATVQTRSTRQAVRRFSRPFEFSFSAWTVRAAGAKIGQYGLGAGQYIGEQGRRDTVLQFLSSLEEEQRLEGELQRLYGDPELEDREQQIDTAEEAVRTARAERQRLQGIAETVLQQQTSVVLSDLGIGIGGKAFPPVSFRFSDPPFALIVSPRHVIRQEANIQLETELTLERRVALEESVADSLDVSTLVVPIGGYGTYPTMVQMFGSLPWVAEVVTHEWIHNYLTLRPLGFLYNASPELRTMNETAATLLGQEIGRQVLSRYYPSHVPPEPADGDQQEEDVEEPDPPEFDFRSEMRITRERVDELLAQGEIEQAEAYMERRREVFWEHGYQIRKLNQAYFAFYGSYAAQPGGAAGDDPVGAAVRELWDRLDDPILFLRTMAWMDGPEDLADALGRPIQTP
ncbi:MAG: hypothetical protein R3191_06970 [Anaerolineales bacterium]|nr:hypothetical protein [Anaerolineales bacterium]